MTAAEPTQNEQPEYPEDVESDPALSDQKGFDWTDEGGATAHGPATNTPLDPDVILTAPRPKPGPPPRR